MIVCLCVLDAVGRPTGVTFFFDSHACFVFGRDVNAHCRITNDPAVSRHHFLLEVIPPDARIQDLGSTNGLYVNDVHFGGHDGHRNPDGSAVTIALRHGDRIRVGQTQLEVQIRLPVTETSTRFDLGGIDTLPRGSLGPLDQTMLAQPIVLPAAGGTPVSPVSPAVAPDVLRCRQCGRTITDASAVTRDGEIYCYLCRATAAPERPPEILGYELGDVLGRGVMGVVYRARRVLDGATVAVKVLAPEAEFRVESVILFRREIAVMRPLTHENIAVFHEMGLVDGRLFLVMEYLPGGNLEQRLAARGPMPVEVALPWMRQVAGGLAAAHRLNLVHRDLKPANLLFDAPGDDARIKIADFGLAKSLQSAGLSGFTATGMDSGTAACLPPEQLTDIKRATKAGDVFSLGATFYEMLTGRSPYNFQPGKEHAATVLAFDLTPLSECAPRLPSALASLVERCLLSDPTRRFADAGEVAARLPE